MSYEMSNNGVEAMVAKLDTHGKPNTPLDGHVNRVRTIMYFTVEPPAITRVQLTGHANVTAVVSRITAGVAGDQPRIEAGRHTYDLDASRADVYATATKVEFTTVGSETGQAAYFSSIAHSIEQFVPNSQQQP
jgi:hypothetical protein